VPGVNFLHRLLGELQSLPVAVDGASKVSGNEFRPFSLPDQLSEGPLSQQSSGCSRRLILLPREDELTLRKAGDQDDNGIVVRPGLKKLRPGSKSGGLTKSGSFELRGKLLLELPRHPALFVIQAGGGELPFLDHEAHTERYQRDAGQEDRREEEDDLSPV
jgi:hypothetical protein